MVPGPYQWCSKEDLFTLKRNYGQVRSFPSLMHLSISSRLRLATFENLVRGGLKLRTKARTLKETMAFSAQCLGRTQLWFSWFSAGILQDLLSCYEQISQAGLSVETLKEKAAGPQDDEDSLPHARGKRMKRDFQKTVRRELDLRFEVNPVSRMRFKLERWNLPGFPGRTAERFVRALSQLKEHLPPRVCAAILRTAWNGWCTKRRFQSLGACVFGCGAFLQADSVEHYSGCRVCVASSGQGCDI